MKTGVGYRREISSWIATHPPGVDCLEITAEHFFHHRQEQLAKLASQVPLYVHGLALSLGTPGPLDKTHLQQFKQVADLARAQWVSDHIAFTRTAEVDLGHLNPIPPSSEMLQVLVEHVRQVMDCCQRPMLMENITSHVRLTGDLREPDFINQLCARSGCKLLLDVTNLFINARNHGYDPLMWLRDIQPENIVQLHIVGYSRQGERYADSHAAPIQNELLDLAREVVKYAPVEAVILERDEDIPDLAGLTVEIAKLQNLRAGH